MKVYSIWPETHWQQSTRWMLLDVTPGLAAAVCLAKGTRNEMLQKELELRREQFRARGYRGQGAL